MFDRKEFFEKQKALLGDWGKQIEDLKEKARNAQVDASVKAENYIDDLRDRLDEVRDKLDTLQEVGEDMLEDMKQNLEKLIAELKQALENVKSKFN